MLAWGGCCFEGCFLGDLCLCASPILDLIYLGSPFGEASRVLFRSMEGSDVLHVYHIYYIYIQSAINSLIINVESS